MNSSGRVLTIFLVIIAILLISLTAISLFFFQKETERRKIAETTIEEYRVEKDKLALDLKEIKKQNFLLQEKNKEADDRINDLSDELELEKGLREEMKLESAELKKQMEEAVSEKNKLTQQIQNKSETQDKLKADLAASQKKIKELEDWLKAEAERGRELGELYEQQQKERDSQLEEIRALKENVAQKVSSPSVSDGGNDGLSGDAINQGVELEEIVVNSNNVDSSQGSVSSGAGASLEETVGTLDVAMEGRILSVDTETEFVIVSLGEKDGLGIGNVLSVYRGEDHVGDIEITRLQAEMSAADLIPPFSIRNVKKDDQVKAK